MYEGHVGQQILCPGRVVRDDNADVRGKALDPCRDAGDFVWLALLRFIFGGILIFG